MFCSCSLQKRTTVKNYPADTPFVFDNKIVLQSDLSKDEKKRLSAQLENYWDDSLRANRVQQFVFFYKIKNPPIFDTINLSRSQKFMNSYLNSQGFYYAQFKDTFFIDSFKDQLRTTVVMNVNPGKATLVDSLQYNFKHPELDTIALANKKSSAIKPGKTAFSKQVVADELDRLVSLYRQHGYFQLTRNNLVAVVDTTDVSLLQLLLDPFEQAREIAAAAERRKQNPRSKIEITERENPDSSFVDSSTFKPYYVGHVYFYPETGFTTIPDSLMNRTDLHILHQTPDFTEYGKRGLFKFKPLMEHTYMRNGNIYNEERFFKTINNFNQIGAWQQVDSRTVTRQDTVDFHYFLVPATKQNITVDLEASRNTGDFLSAGNLFGLAINMTYRNRNVWKRAIQSSTGFRNGVELSFEKPNDLLQTLQSTLSHTYSIPWFIAPFKIKNRFKLDGIKTQFGINGSYSDRKDFFRLRSLVTNWGYEWKRKNRIWQYKPLNLELYSIDTLSGLREAFVTNPFLRTAFNTGSVVSQSLTYNVTYPGVNRPDQSNYIRVGVEEAGGIFGRIPALQDRIYQYIKLEGEYRKLIPVYKNSWAFRAFAGIGFNYSSNPKIGNTLPFFKQFIAGGPNSMRAWGLRQLGLGSSLLSDTSSTFRDRYGDMQLEANIEYRFPLFQIGVMNVSSALFADIGNIWNIRKDPSNPLSEFSLMRLPKDIAIGVGTGIRLDFNYFLIRLDAGLKLKDPTRHANSGWMDFSDFTWKNKEYIIKDPITGSVVNLNNYAVQLGIGLPF